MNRSSQPQLRPVYAVAPQHKKSKKLRRVWHSTRPTRLKGKMGKDGKRREKMGKDGKGTYVVYVLTRLKIGSTWPGYQDHIGSPKSYWYCSNMFSPCPDSPCLHRCSSEVESQYKKMNQRVRTRGTTWSDTWGSAYHQQERNSRKWNRSKKQWRHMKAHESTWKHHALRKFWQKLKSI